RRWLPSVGAQARARAPRAYTQPLPVPRGPVTPLPARADQRGVRERGPGQGRPHRADLRARPRRGLSPSVGEGYRVRRPQGCDVGEARRRRETAAPHQALERGAVKPERSGSPAHVSAVLLEGLSEKLPLQPLEGLSLPCAKAITVFT